MEIEVNEKELVQYYRLDNCTRCANECSRICPIYDHYGKFEPRDLARLFLEGGKQAVESHRLLRTCVMCRACTQACPYGVEFADFIRELRVGINGYRHAFGGIAHSYRMMQARGPNQAAVKARRIEFSAPLALDPSSDVILFTGCLSLFDALTDSDTFSTMARAAVKLLNRVGISPAVLEDERCCGRDLYDIGARDSFLALAKHNSIALAARGAKTVVTICPECAYTISRTYGKELGKQPYEVRHIAEYLAERAGDLLVEQSASRFAIHSGCYLSRYLGIGDAPRKLLATSCAKSIVELPGLASRALCCGAGSLVEHGPHTRRALEGLLAEAQRAGASTLITTCPKCMLVYKEVIAGCSWRSSATIMKDLMTFLASGIG